MKLWRVLSLGAGYQSSTMLMMAAEGAFGDVPDVAVFADTGWEPQPVYTHLKWLEEHSPIPIVRVSADRNLRDDTAGWVQHQGLPVLSVPVFTINLDGSKGMLHRQCTTNYKIRPIHQYVRHELLGLRRYQHAPANAVEQWMGISIDEVERMRDATEHWITNRYPLVDAGLSRADCAAWWAERYPDHALPRSACSGCPYRTDAEWSRLKREAPDDYADAIAVDDAMRSHQAERRFDGVPYLHRRRKPVAEAVAEYEADQAMNPTLPGFELHGDECGGVCFV